LFDLSSIEFEMSESDRHINFKLMRDHILATQEGKNTQSGKQYWRSLEELADSPAFTEFVTREYPQHAEVWDNPIERRGFIKLMGASLALAGLSGCVFQPPEKIVPYIKQPEEGIPGKPLFFATAAVLFGAATPVIVRSNEGRPTKIEGNPDHPNNRPSEFSADDPGSDPRGSSATDIFTQASILSLYDPDRSQTLTYREDIRTWTAFVGEMRTILDTQRAQQGQGIRFLTEPITSPTLGAEINALLTALPKAKWHQYEPANRDNSRAGAVMALGQPVNTLYRFDLAERVLSLDSDFLSALPGSLRYARDFMARRRVTEKKSEMNRLYVIETTPSNTGAVADHQWCIKPSEFEATVRSISSALSATAGPAEVKLSSGANLGPMVRDLQQHRGASIVVAGDGQPPAVHALAHAMNAALGNVGKTVLYTDPLEVKSVDQRESLQDLVKDLDAGIVELLVIIGGNPVYNSPADLKIDQNRLDKNKNLIRVHLSPYKDETSDLCHWHIPETHYLESWGDARSYDGTVSIIQPLIEPLYDGKTALELLAVFSEQYDRKPLDIVKQYWQRTGIGTGSSVQPQATPPAGSTQPEQARTAGSTPANAGVPQPQAVPANAGRDFEASWRKALHDGFIPNTAFATKQLTAQSNAPASTTSTTNAGGFELIFRTDPSIYDGRFANNGWLQELPRPLTKVTWDNVALISPNSAQQFGFKDNGGSVKGREHYVPTANLVDQKGRSVRVPLWITPGQPDNVLTIHLGYGRLLAGNVGGKGENVVGFDAYKLRDSYAAWFTSGVQVQVTNVKHELATTQLHFNMEDPNFSKEPRDIVRSKTLEEFLKETEQHEEAHDSLYPEFPQLPNSPNYAWGMAIDLNNCVGCNACTIACQAENNIPIVGKEQVARSREMHWIRVDTYFKGFDPVKPEGTNFMPVPCMHCENAPCEPVCPVHATVHSAEGLNDMVYNRCVGTKYCSNNCPYKVRRFNFFLYNDWDTPQYQLMRNPDVSVRSRGVMEKCTYCVQRIQGAKIQSELEGRRVEDGEIVTACQAVCPTEAIVFGDISDPNSRVSKVKASKRDYSLLGELNTKPRTTYLTQLKNPNPELGS
jgi:MoCo/4Fe-4S cofactor protein with predicted Tat translocation signal